MKVRHVILFLQLWFGFAGLRSKLRLFVILVPSRREEQSLNLYEPDYMMNPRTGYRGIMGRLVFGETREYSSLN